MAQSVKPFIAWYLRVWRALIHIPVGAAIIYFGSVNGFFGWAMLLLFIVYEVTEDWRLADEAHYDIFGAIIGVPVGFFTLPLFHRLLELLLSAKPLTGAFW